jgi:ribonuclease III
LAVLALALVGALGADLQTGAMNRNGSISLEEVEAKIGHVFRDRDLLVQALTHISAVTSERRTGSYQRLEFLGDRVLGLVVSAMIYASFPSADEGDMSRRLAALVRRETCADMARAWDLGSAVRLGESEAKSGGRNKPAILADICEAVIGAVFLDGGYPAAEAVILSAWEPLMHRPARPLQDAKTALQEWAQSLGKPAPVYRETGRRGPAHRPEFTVGVDIEGVGTAEGVGTSKRIAEQVAAESFMKKHGVNPSVPEPSPVPA